MVTKDRIISHRRQKILHRSQNRGVCVVDCFATILTPAQNFFWRRCGLLSKFFAAIPSTLNVVASTLYTAFVPIPGHLQAHRPSPNKHTDRQFLYILDGLLFSLFGRGFPRRAGFSARPTIFAIGPAGAVWRCSADRSNGYIHCVSKNTPGIFRCNSSRHCWILIIFGRNVSLKTCNRRMVYFPNSPN